MLRPKKTPKRPLRRSLRSMFSRKKGFPRERFSRALWEKLYEKEVSQVLASLPSNLRCPLKDLISVLWGASAGTYIGQQALGRLRSLPKDSKYARRFNMVLKTILFCNPDPQVRRGVIRWLLGNVLHSAAAAERINVERHVTTLFGALKDPSLSVSCEAALGLARVRDKRAVPVLGRAVKEGASVSVRSNAIKALAYIGGKEVFKSLVDGLLDPHSWNRSRAIKGLEEIGLKEAVRPLQRVASKDKVLRVKEEAQAAIEKIEKK